MSGIHTAYRDQIVRCIVGAQPAMLSTAYDSATLDAICRRLTDAEEAMQLLCAKGYARPAQSLVDVVRSLPSVRAD